MRKSSELGPHASVFTVSTALGVGTPRPGSQGGSLGKLWILLPLVTLLLLPKVASGGGVEFPKELPPLPQATGFLPN